VVAGIFSTLALIPLVSKRLQLVLFGVLFLGSLPGHHRRTGLDGWAHRRTGFYVLGSLRLRPTKTMGVLVFGLVGGLLALPIIAVVP